MTVHSLIDKTGYPSKLTPEARAKGWEAHTFYARCGYHAPQLAHGRKPAEFSAWASDVTCAGCRS